LVGLVWFGLFWFGYCCRKLAVFYLLWQPTMESCLLGVYLFDFAGCIVWVCPLFVRNIFIFVCILAFVPISRQRFVYSYYELNCPL
jgi:hypothetical protein